MRTCGKSVLIVVAVVAGTMVWNVYGRFQPSSRNVSLTQVLRDVDSGKIETISIHGDEVVGVNTQTGSFRTYTPRGYVGFVNRLIDRGVDVSEVYHYAGREGRVNGPDPERRSYASWASFSDPAGNGWLLQEVTAREPGRVDADGTIFVSFARVRDCAPARLGGPSQVQEAHWRPAWRELAGTW